MIHTIKTFILPAALSLLPASMSSQKARVMLLAIGLQESRFAHRQQKGGGPAQGFWQFEEIAVSEILSNPMTRTHMRGVLAGLKYTASTDDAKFYHKALQHNDVLACAFARLLLWTHPNPLPETAEEGWAQYLQTWRPGKPHPETWTDNFETAAMLVGGQE